MITVSPSGLSVSMYRYMCGFTHVRVVDEHRDTREYRIVGPDEADAVMQRKRRTLRDAFAARDRASMIRSRRSPPGWKR